MTRTMGDSTTASDIPANVDMVAGYIDGNYQTFSELAKLFPGKPAVSITTYLGTAAVVCDVENGNATPAEAVGWAKQRRAMGEIPSIYCNDATWQEVLTAFAAAGEPVPLWWEARYDNVASLDPGRIAKQYGGNLPGHYDLSVVADYWPGVDSSGGEIMATEADAILQALNNIQHTLTVLYQGTPTPGGNTHPGNLTSILASVQSLYNEVAGLKSEVDAIKAKIGA